MRAAFQDESHLIAADGAWRESVAFQKGGFVRFAVYLMFHPIDARNRYRL